jgi:ABC-type antimicrobial peptide transport system permease subunit
MILADTLVFIFAGTGLGLAIILYLKRIYAGLLSGVIEYNGYALVLSGCIAIAVSVLAVFMPTYRALSADPAQSLRYE